MGLRVAVEGSDGSGKSSVIAHLSALARERRLTTEVIGRKGDYATRSVNAMTSLLSIDLQTNAECRVRLARAWQRADQAARSPADIVLIDRFVVSDLARIQPLAEADPSIGRELHEIFQFSLVAATLRCECPFDLSWTRTLTRGAAHLSKKELRGYDYNLALSTRAESIFYDGRLTGHRYQVDTAQDLDDTKRKLAVMLDVLLTLR